MSQLADSNISVVNNVFIKQMTFKDAGDYVLQHAHMYDHQTLIATGGVRVTVDGIETEYLAPSIIVITAGKFHQLVSLAPQTVAYCIHAIKGGETLDEAEPLVEGLKNTEVEEWQSH
jgi:quercetin dioxygenase-like cupin family protein